MKDPTLEAAIRFVKRPLLIRLWERYKKAVGYRPRPWSGDPRFQSTVYPGGSDE